MNILNLDCIHDFGRVEVDGICPEWVTMEQLYNCEDFYQAFEGHRSFLKELFGRLRHAA